MKEEQIWDLIEKVRRGGALTRRAFIKILLAVSAAVSLLPFGKLQEFLIPKVESLETVRKKIANVKDLEPNSFVVFGYPGDAEENPRYSNILIRLKNGEFRAYNRVCTHLQCLVSFEPENDRIFCPCHAGTYNPEDGTVTSGPPPRALPEVILETDENGDIWAVGIKGEIGRGR